jgi:hypothetical protein
MFTDSFPIQNFLKQGDALSPLLLEGLGKPAGTELERNTSACGIC